MTKLTQYRIYAGGNIVHQDDFEEYDNAQPYYDDYGEYTIPDELIDFIAGSDLAVDRQKIGEIKSIKGKQLTAGTQSLHHHYQLNEPQQSDEEASSQAVVIDLIISRPHLINQISNEDRERGELILAEKDGWDNALAMETSVGDMKKRHSNVVLLHGSLVDHVHAMKHSVGDMKKRHSDHVLEKNDPYNNMNAMEYCDGEMKKRHSDLVIASGSFSNARAMRHCTGAMKVRHSEQILKSTDSVGNLIASGVSRGKMRQQHIERSHAINKEIDHQVESEQEPILLVIHHQDVEIDQSPEPN